MSVTALFEANAYTVYWRGYNSQLRSNSFSVHGKDIEGDDNPTSSRIRFADNTLASMQAIASNHNITIDDVQIYLPQMYYSGGVGTNSRITVGVHISSDTQWDSSTYNTEMVAPGNMSEPGKWVQLPIQTITTFLSDSGNYLLMRPYDTHSYYSNTYQSNSATGHIQIRITYHYHNSEPSFSGTSCAFGSPVTLNLTTHYAGYTHQAVFSVGSETSTVTLAQGVTSYQFTPPMAWIAQLPNAVTGTLNAKLTTYDSGNVVGDEPTVSIEIAVPASVVPTPGTISYTVDNAFNVPISNRGLVASLSGQAGVYGSTIRNYTIEAEGYSNANGSLTMDTITRIPSQTQQRTLTITATVTDSRGRNASTSLNVTVYEWDLPYFSAIEYYRCNAQGQKSESGHYIRLQGTYACFSVNGLNSIEPCAIKIVERSSGTEIDAGTLSQNTPKVIGGGLISDDEEYLLQLTLTDEEATVVREYTVYSAAFVMHFKHGGTGVAFGQAATEDNTVRINPAWALLVGNNIDVASKLADLESRISALE